MSKIILNVDASALKESGCVRRFYWSVVKGYRAPLQTNDVEFGSAFHEFVKVMRFNPGRYDLAVAAATKRYSVPMDIKPEKSYMTVNYLLNVCLLWYENYDKQDSFVTVVEPVSKRPMVEAKFSVPYLITPELEVNLCGTIDDVCKHKHGTYALRDYKTTSVWKKEQYLSGYALSPQLMFYRMILKKYADLYPDSIFAEINKVGLCCFIDGVFLAGAKAPPTFARSEMFNFPAAQMEEFECLVSKKIDELVYYVLNNKVPQRTGMLNGSCQTVYGDCKFFAPCRQIDDISTQHLLNRYFIQKPYNPLKFGDEHKQKIEEQTTETTTPTVSPAVSQT
jgi:hypothetical protein